uniref:Mitochondrial fission factor n=1 Tax=Angiostrongylus cantonensis TaxID=6313 RepID=A0A158PBF5_ANGCA
MIVPEHISGTGESVKASEFDGKNVAGRERLMQLMNVPDRIVLTGGNSYEGFETEPLELMKDYVTQKREESIQDLPSVITLERKPYLDRGEPNLMFSLLFAVHRVVYHIIVAEGVPALNMDIMLKQVCTVPGLVLPKHQ